MKKTVYLAILSLVTVFCIITGSIYHISGWIGFGLGSIFSFISGDGDNSSSSSSRNRITYSKDLDEFNRIEIDTNAMNITIRQGDTYHLEYDCTEKRKPEFGVNGNTLRIRQTEAKGWLRNHFNDKCDMTVTIPSGSVLNSADITTDIGSAYINDISCKNFSIEADIGDISIKSCTFEDSEIENDIGSINITKSSLGLAKIEADTGNIDLTACTFGDTEIYNDVGNVKLNSSGTSLLNYNIDLSTELGSIKYNGEKQKNYFHQTSSGPSAAYNIIIETDIGNIIFN